MTDAILKPSRAARWRRIRMLALLGALALLAGYTATDLYAGRALDTELARLERQHGDLRTPTLVAPSVPAAENRARLVSAAASLAMPLQPELRTSLNNFGSAGNTDTVPADLRAFVEDNREALQMASTFVTRAKASWNVDYGGGGTVPLLEMRDLSDIIFLKAMMELEARRPDQAARALSAGLAASSSLNNEPALIAQLVRIAMADRQFAGIQRLLAQSDPSKAALDDLGHWLRENRSDPSRTGLEAEFAYVSRALWQMEAGRPDSSPAGPFPASRLALRIGRPFLRLAHVRDLRTMEGLLANQAGPRPRPEWEPPKPSWSPIDKFANLSLPGLARTVQTGDEYMSGLGACEIAVALRRYRLDHASYPDGLEALTPAYLDKLPINPHTGKVPVYARAGDGFTLKAPRDQRYQPRLQDWKIDR
jgi:hypothetical protein